MKRASTKKRPLLSKRRQHVLIHFLIRLPIGKSKWEYGFLQRLANQEREPEPIELRALDSVAHHYREQLNVGREQLHVCTKRCERYELPETEEWAAQPLFPVEKFTGYPTYMREASAPILEL